MATVPYFVLSPNTLVSALGLIRGPDKTVPTPFDDWQRAAVDVVIPALNEEKNIVRCLASVARQTRKPRRVYVIDDGSGDRTVEFAREFAQRHGLDLVAIHRKEPIGKTPTLKKQARSDDADVEFILDADTVLESENYLERAVQELYQGVGIASACGTILPLRRRDHRRVLDWAPVRDFAAAHPDVNFGPRPGFWHRLRQAVTDVYRNLLYHFLQRFIYRGQMTFFGTITNPVGCAVAYRREYLKNLFDHYEPILGDDLTNSEDIFLGFALLNRGYRNIQLQDVVARTVEPEAQRLPRQIKLWSSSFLQTCYYFDALVRSPFKAFARWRQRRRDRQSGRTAELENRRQVQEAYRQPFGEDHTRIWGRPVGWMVLSSLFEKISFPAALLIMIILRLWEPLLITLAAEAAVSLAVLAAISPPGRRLLALLQAAAILPLRYFLLASDLYTIGVFAKDLWLTKNRKWRK